MVGNHWPLISLIFLHGMAPAARVERSRGSLTATVGREQNQRDPAIAGSSGDSRAGADQLAQHPCIVARDKPLLLGYLNIVLGHLTADGDELQIVIDRRPDPLPNQKSVAARPTTTPEQRHVRGVDELLRTQGYAIVSREDGVTWQLNEHGQERFEELDATDELAEEDAMRVPDRRRTLLSALAVVAVVAGVAVALPSDSAYRLADGLFAVADRATSWMSASREVPRTAPGTETARDGH